MPTNADARGRTPPTMPVPVLAAYASTRAMAISEVANVVTGWVEGADVVMVDADRTRGPHCSSRGLFMEYNTER